MSTNDEPGETLRAHGVRDVANAEVAPLTDAAGSRGRVLVIDDDDGIRRVVRRSLDGYDVVTAVDGRRALAVLETSSDFDLILCDVVMPGMSGVQVWCEIAAAHPGLVERFVFMTGGAQSADDERFLSSGVVEVLRKPFSFHALRRLVTERVDARRP